MSDYREEQMTSEEPLFNIGAVSRMTEIPEATLRVWERRYQFPHSTRTTGGHRLYSEQEVRRIQWVKKQMEGGLQASLAIQALRRMEQDSAPPLPQSPATHNSSPPTQITLTTYHRRLLDALLAHDSDGAAAILTESLAFFPLEYLILDVISPTLFDIGEAWSAGLINVATEHFASNTLRHHLLSWMRMGPPAYNVSPVVLACAPGELHEGSLLMLAVLLRRLRWNVVYLGQSMPLQDLANFVEELKPSVIVFAAMTEECGRALTDWTHWLPKVAHEGKPLVAFGGRAFIEHSYLVKQVPGIMLGRTLREGVQKLDHILHELNPMLH